MHGSAATASGAALARALAGRSPTIDQAVRADSEPEPAISSPDSDGDTTETVGSTWGEIRCPGSTCHATTVDRGVPGLDWYIAPIMWHYTLKVAVSALVIVAVAELAKRSSFWAAALASLPLTSLLAFVWLYLDSSDTAAIAQLAQSIFWLVLPSLVLFIALPLLLRAGWTFWPALGLSCLATAGAYGALTWVLSKADIQL